MTNAKTTLSNDANSNATKFQILSAFSPTSRNSDIEFDLKAEPSMTQQNMMDECDINNIMKRYQITGEIPHVNTTNGTFGDYSDLQDYQTSLNIVMAAEDAFSNLPSSIRNRFKNDPAAFLDFVNDENNREEAIELGLIPDPKKSGADAPSAPSGSHIAGDGAAGGSTPPDDLTSLRAKIQALEAKN